MGLKKVLPPAVSHQRGVLRLIFYVTLLATLFVNGQESLKIEVT